MKILALDTATEACSVAYADGKQLVHRYQFAPREHANLVLPMIKQVMQEAEVVWSDIELLAFGQGPGAFTGLRIAAGVAQGLAFAHDFPVVGVSSLQAMAQQAFAVEGKQKVLSVIDARMAEVYIAAYQVIDGVMQAVTEEKVCQVTDSEILQSLQGDWFAVGSGCQTYHQELVKFCQAELLFEQHVSFPDAQFFMPIAQYQARQFGTLSATEIEPVYLRNNVAKKKAQQ